MSKKITVLVFVAGFLGLQASAQYYLTGQDPASVRWKQINTGRFQIVFPGEYEKTARYYANVLELSSPFVAEPYLQKQKKVTVVLHNRSTVSNAMVSPAPFHADFFEMPSQDIYPQLWQDQLALHEYRHVVQMIKLRQGFTKGIYYVFGEQGVAAVFGAFLPFWFVEGDAVFSETLHSMSGRGRVPDFTYKLKAQVDNLKIYKYDKAQFGSYKDFVPDHYTLGYQLVTYGTTNWGMEMWDKMLNRVARKPFTLVPFTYSLKKTTGKGKVGFYNDAMIRLQNQWKKEDTVPDVKTILVRNKFYTNYLFPNLLSDGSLICEKTGIDDINRFVRIYPDGTEKRVFTPGYDFRESLSANDSLICWNEKRFDPRWSNRDYSVIMLYNFKTGRLKTLTRKSRLFAPALSHHARRIAAVQVTTTGENSLCILSAKNGKILQRFSTPDNLFFMTPSWSANDSVVVVVALGKKGKRLMTVDLASGKFVPVTPFTFAEMKRPILKGDYVVFTGSFEGKDNLYAIRIPDKKIFRVVEARYGVDYVSSFGNNDTLAFSVYTAEGFKPATIIFDSGNLVPYTKGFVPAKYPVDNLVTGKTFVLDKISVPDSDFQVKKYGRAAHLFNPYSWGPLSVDADNIDVQPGLTLLSQNKLSTAVSSLSYLYDLNEQTGKVRFVFDYYGWYPVIGLKADYGGRRRFVNDQNGEMQEVRWKETDISLNISVPLNLTKGKWIRGLKPSMGLHQRFLKMNPGSSFSFKEDRLTIAAAGLFGYVQMKRSRKDIFPRWGIWANMLLRSTLFSDSVSNQQAMQASVYLPGLFKHHGFRFYAAAQRMQEGNYAFGDAVSMPRGFSQLQYPNSLVIKADYALPLAYPDWDVPALFYLKRIYSRIFYDDLYNTETKKWGAAGSVGAELYTDWHFLSLFPETELGIRYSLLLNQKKSTFDFLFNVSF